MQAHNLVTLVGLLVVVMVIGMVISSYKTSAQLEDLEESRELLERLQLHMKYEYYKELVDEGRKNRTLRMDEHKEWLSKIYSYEAYLEVPSEWRYEE